MRFWPATLLLALASCGGTTAPDVDAWMVRREFNKPATDQAAGRLIELGPIRVSPHLSGIVVQRQDGEIDTLVYQRWAAPVAEMVRAWVRSRLTEHPGGRGGRDSASAVDSRLFLEVRRFEFVESTGGTTEALVELWGSLDGEPFGPLRGASALPTSTGPQLPVAMAGALNEAVEHLVLLVDARLADSAVDDG